MQMPMGRASQRSRRDTAAHRRLTECEHLLTKRRKTQAPAGRRTNGLLEIQKVRPPAEGESTLAVCLRRVERAEYPGVQQLRDVLVGSKEHPAKEIPRNTHLKCLQGQQPLGTVHSGQRGAVPDGSL